jgi:hypothetical protein
MSTQPVAVLSGGEMTVMTNDFMSFAPNAAFSFMPPVHALDTRHAVTMNDETGVIKVRDCSS